MSRCVVVSGSPVGVCELSVVEGWCLPAADAELLCEAHDAPVVLAVDAELVAGEEPLGRLPGAGCLDVCALLAGLPSASEDDGPVDGRALLAVDVLRVGETDVPKVLAAERDLPLGAVEQDGQAVLVVGSGDWPRVPFSTWLAGDEVLAVKVTGRPRRGRSAGVAAGPRRPRVRRGRIRRCWARALSLSMLRSPSHILDAAE